MTGHGLAYSPPLRLREGNDTAPTPPAPLSREESVGAFAPNVRRTSTSGTGRESLGSLKGKDETPETAGQSRPTFAEAVPWLPRRVLRSALSLFIVPGAVPGAGNDILADANYTRGAGHSDEHRWTDAVANSVTRGDLMALEAFTMLTREYHERAPGDARERWLYGRVASVLQSHGAALVRAAQLASDHGTIDGPLLGEVIRDLGDLRHEATVAARRLLAEAALTHPEAVVRDAAAASLVGLGDREAVAPLIRALDREPLAYVREAFSDAIEQLSE